MGYNNNNMSDNDRKIFTILPPCTGSRRNYTLITDFLQTKTFSLTAQFVFNRYYFLWYYLRLHILVHSREYIIFIVPI